MTTEFKDLITTHPELQINLLDKGYVRLVDVMPRVVPMQLPTADYAIVEAARNSYNLAGAIKGIKEDRGLIRYLFRHRHTTPMEMVEFKFACQMPIMVARQWIRHRTANVNEMSGRYSELPNDFYIPELENVRAQSKVNKQGSDVPIDPMDAKDFILTLKGTCKHAYEDYESALKKGIGKEQARMLLPVNLYTKWFWKIDAHNLFHFLALRCDSHAQMEIRVFADAMLKLISPIMPWAVEAFEDYHPMRQGLLLTRLEVEALKRFLTGDDGKACTWGKDFSINTDNKRESEEWITKAKKLGLDIA